MRGPRVVALGGGHGLASSLRALRHVTEAITAVVTVADNGGSSGRLRRDFGILPPGDLRMALAALCDEAEWGLQWRDVLQHRISGDGELGGHAIGNLLIMSLWDLLGDPVAGLDVVAKLLGAHGRVLPMASIPLEIQADVRGADPAYPDGITVVTGQVQVATTPGHVLGLRLLPDEPPACLEAVEAVRSADALVLGPGSWFTSVMPHLLVPELSAAIVGSPARKVLTLNLEMDTTETSGFTAADHLEVLAAHAPDLRLDVVLADSRVAGSQSRALGEAASDLGAELVIAPLAQRDHPGSHDPLKLAAAYADLVG